MPKTPILYALVIVGVCGGACETPAPTPSNDLAAPPADLGAAADQASTADQRAPEAENPAVWDTVDALGFYDSDGSGASRAIREDLKGALTGMIQFAQSHTVDPSGNGARNHPTLVAQREALLLFTPSLPEIQQLKVIAAVNGVLKGELPLRHPNEQFRSDYANQDGRADLVYSRRAWTAVLPWDWLVPGLSLTLTDQRQRSGTLAAARIEFAAPGEIVFQSVRLGLLTDPPRSGQHPFLSDTARAATDYFQTIPAARLVAASYDDVKLDQAIVASGVIYSTASAVNGDVYSGDLREDVAKAQVSTGINLANMGIPSAAMNQQNPHLFVQMTVHHAAGNYQNGVQVHGLSGGNGIITLIDSEGNEFSHEVGHAYGLGHYPGADASNNPVDYFWSAHHADSGWGFIGHRKRLRANVHWRWDGTGAVINGVKSPLSFRGIYSYNRDPMSGGEVVSSLSRYTHHTGYSAVYAQRWLDRPIPDASQPGGYVKWDGAAGRLAPYAFPAADRRLPPRKVGVPVYTLLGGYDPLQKALINPVFRGNYGNVFDLPAPSSDLSARACYVEISFAAGAPRLVDLAAQRHSAAVINQLQINIDQAEQPRLARLLCRAGGGAAAVELARRDFPQGLAPMAAAVVVGKGEGYRALRAQELPLLEQQLKAAKDSAHPILSADTQVLLTSWEDALAGLGTDAQAAAARFRSDAQALRAIARFINQQQAQLDANDAATRAALVRLVRDAGLAEDATRLLPAGKGLTVDGGKCLKAEGAAGSLQLVVVAAAQCADEPAQRFVQDGRGAIHSAAQLTHCITADGAFAGRLTLSPCRADSLSQGWRYGADQVLSWAAQSNRVIDLDRQNGYPVLYSPTGGANQRWAGLAQSQSPLLVYLSAAHLAVLARL